jgi:hypothetical protein
MRLFSEGDVLRKGAQPEASVGRRSDPSRMPLDIRRGQVSTGFGVRGELRYRRQRGRRPHPGFGHGEGHPAGGLRSVAQTQNNALKFLGYPGTRRLRDRPISPSGGVEKRTFLRRWADRQAPSPVAPATSSVCDKQFVLGSPIGPVTGSVKADAVAHLAAPSPTTTNGAQKAGCAS